MRWRQFLNQKKKCAHTNRGSHKPEAGYLQRLSSTGEALSYLAGNDLDEFMVRLSALPALAKNATDEVNAMPKGSLVTRAQALLSI